MMYASIVVDVSAKGVDKTFEYSVPEPLAGGVTVGSIVVVPFGKTERLGYVVALSATPAHGSHADIDSIVDEPPVFDANLARLAEWTAEKYISSLSAAVRLLLPPGRGRRLRQLKDSDGPVRYSISKPQVRGKTEAYAKLAVGFADIEDLAGPLAVKAPRQAAALKALADGPLPAHKLASQYGADSAVLRALEKKQLVKIYREDAFREPDFTYPDELPLDLKPTPEQAAAIEAISSAETGVFLLQGVTGSGKTEVYLRVIGDALRLGKSAIVLVPEIALTPQTVSRFRSRFGEHVAVLHSGLSVGERYDQWNRIRSGACDVVVGARSAIWAPVKNLGLVVVDEEHETSYKQDRDPRYHAREVAIERARIEGARVVLGSATPAIESRYKADKGEYKLLKLPVRILDRPMPDVKIVDMRTEKRTDAAGFFSESLTGALAETIRLGDKAIIFLNRRGFANFIICRDCGHVIVCDRCNVSMTYHAREKALLCHHCGMAKTAPSVCPECGGAGIGFFGAGTERIENELKEMFPDTAVTRMDSDTTGAKDAHRKHLAGFKGQKGGILLGTQMIAKGLDFPDVTLVGIVNADTALNLPDFRAGERTFQTMMQVGGRAGRGDSPGRVIVQTYNPENYAVQALITGDYDTFYEQEVTLRDALDYPPFCELINIGISAADESEATELADKTAEYLTRAMDEGRLTGVKELLGPAPAPISKLKNRHRAHIVLKTDGSAGPRAFLRDMHAKLAPSSKSGVILIYDVDPLSLL